MSLRDQVQNLQARAAQMREEIFGSCVVEFFRDKIEGTSDFVTDGYHSSFRRAVKSDQSGFMQPHDAVVRIRKRAGFVPEVNKFIRVTMQDPARTQFELKIMEMPHHTFGVEWVLGCKAVH